MTDTPSTTVSDDAFQALANPDRRQLLFALEECGPTGTVAITDVVCDAERDPESLRMQFHHNHLPRLEAKDFVASNADAVERGSNFDELRPLLGVLRRLRRTPESTTV